MPSHVYAVEDVLRRGLALYEREEVGRGAASLRRALPLTLVHRAALGRYLRVRLAEQRVVRANVGRQHLVCVFGTPAPEVEDVPEQALRLPHFHRLELLGEARGVARGVEGFGGEYRRGRVLPVAALARRGEAGDDYVGAEAAYDPDHVGEHLVMAPDAEGLFGRLREAEVDGAREELLRAVDATRREKLLRPNDAEHLSLLRAQEVLPAVAARERQIRRARAAPPRQIREQRRVLVVRVRADVEDAPRHEQLAERGLGLGRVPLRGLLRAREGRREEEKEEKGECREARGYFLHV